MAQLKSYKLYLGLIISLGFFFRIYDIGGESLWADEGWSFHYAKMSIGTLLNDLFFNENNPPLYYLFLNVWIKIFGESELALRLPSAIFGVLLIYFNFRVGELFYDKSVGLWSSFITAVSLFFIEYSQEARVYMLFALLSCLSMKCYIEIGFNRGISKRTEYIIWTVLLIYSHVYSVFFVVAQNIIYVLQKFVFKKKDSLGLIAWIYLQSIVLLLAFPWFFSYLIRAQDIQDNFWLASPTLTTLKQTFLVFGQKSNLVLLIFFLLSVFAVLKIKKVYIKKSFGGFLEKLYSLKLEVKFNKIEEGIYIAVWAFIPIIIPFVLSMVSQPIYHVRYAIGSAIPFYLLIAAGAKNALMESKTATVSFLILLLMLSAGKINGYYQNVQKEQFREAFAYIEKKSDPGDLILTNARAIQWTTYSYYKEREDLLAVGFPKDSSSVSAKNLDELREITRGHGRVWVVLSHSGDVEKIIPKSLKNWYTLIESPSFKGIEIFEFVSNL